MYEKVAVRCAVQGMRFENECRWQLTQKSINFGLNLYFIPIPLSTN